MLHKTMPIPPEKIKLKLLIPSPEPEISTPSMPIQRPQPIPKAIKPTPIPKAIEPHVTTPPTPRILTQSKPITPSAQPVVTATVPIVTKAPETLPVAAPKAPPPPPPKVQENYEEENLGRIRSILAERLKYPKNALRLKQQGETTVTFTLGTDRSVSQITITKSSEFELLDEAARALIESSASEFPKPSKSVRISVPIAYKIR